MEYHKFFGLNKISDVQPATTVFICQLSNVFALRGGLTRRLKGESSILSGFHAFFKSFLVNVFFAVIEDHIF